MNSCRFIIGGGKLKSKMKKVIFDRLRAMVCEFGLFTCEVVMVRGFLTRERPVCLESIP